MGKGMGSGGKAAGKQAGLAQRVAGCGSVRRKPIDVPAQCVAAGSPLTAIHGGWSASTADPGRWHQAAYEVRNRMAHGSRPLPSPTAQ